MTSCPPSQAVPESTATALTTEPAWAKTCKMVISDQLMHYLATSFMKICRTGTWCMLLLASADNCKISKKRATEHIYEQEKKEIFWVLQSYAEIELEIHREKVRTSSRSDKRFTSVSHERPSIFRQKLHFAQIISTFTEFWAYILQNSE